MCCGCCSVNQQKAWVFGIGGVLFIVGLVLVIWWPTWAWDILYGELPLSPNSITFNKWSITPIPVYLYMYLFNWTNAEDVRVPGVKPNFQQLGPYVYREEKTKEDVVWNDNNTISFYGKRTWFFEPEMSGGKPDDMITVPHLPSIAAATAVRDMSPAIKLFFNSALNRNGGALYKTYTASEWLFDGFYDQFLDYAMKLNNSLTSNIQSNEFAWFLNRNGSKEFEGRFTIHTGIGDITQMGEIKFWKGANHTGWYEGDCGRLNGSTADLFVPNRAPDEFITIFITDTCRIINLEPTGETVTLEGIPGVKYETKPNTFDNGQLNDDMKCYCPIDRQPDNCPATGATDLGPCAEGAPMYMSHANFMYADPSYANTITGLKSDYERDNFFIIMEPKLGVPMQVNAAVQVSLRIQSDRNIDILKNVPEFYGPLFITASRAIINKKLAGQVKLALSLPAIGFYIGLSFLIIGSIMIFTGIYLTVKRKWKGQSKISQYDYNLRNLDDLK